MHERLKASLLVLLLATAPPAAADELFRDPMRPYTPRADNPVAPSHLKINALIVSDERRLAIVNGRRVGIGDRIGNATVTAISKHELTLDVGGETRILRLARGQSRQ